MTTMKTSITKKHKYSMGAPDPGGNPMIVVCGEITIISATATTTDTGPEFDLSADIPNLEGCIIQGDSGHYVQYDYTNKQIEVYNASGGSVTVAALSESTATTLAFLVFKFYAWGF